MPKIDPEQERRRLEQYYAQQVDGELEKVAGQAYELTDLAQHALRSELAKRGLTPAFVEQTPVVEKPKATPQPGDPPPAPEPSMEEAAEDEDDTGVVEQQEVIAIRQFRDLPEALLAKGSLESAGIECSLGDENLVRMDWFYSNAVGGIKLMVRAEDFHDAQQILSQPIPEQMEVGEPETYQQPKCPKCGSLDITFQELDPAAYVSLGISYFAVAVPAPIHRDGWRCHSCKAEWVDDGSAAPAKSPA